MYEDYRSQIMFFCGNEPECIEFNNPRALKKAMAVVEEEFSVVGILENLPKTFSVFENYVPRFFKNIEDIYNHSKEEIRNKNFNPHKKKITEALRKTLRKVFSNEMEFYEFCKQRLYRQMATMTQLKRKAGSDENIIRSDRNQNRKFVLL